MDFTTGKQTLIMGILNIHGAKLPDKAMINEFGAIYQIFDCGLVLNTRSKRFLKIHIKPNGYRYVVLTENNISIKMYLHRLVGQAFIPNPKNKPCINHKDGDKANNCSYNLEWCTHKENNSHAFINGLNPNRLGILNK